MSLTRSLGLCRKVDLFLRKPVSGYNLQPSRNSGGLYSYRRAGYPPDKFSIIGANTLSVIMWWWIFWHIWHEPGHIVGEFPYPDPSKWTDEELGIPPDDEAC